MKHIKVLRNCIRWVYNQLDNLIDMHRQSESWLELSKVKDDAGWDDFEWKLPYNVRRAIENLLERERAEVRASYSRE